MSIVIAVMVVVVISALIGLSLSVRVVTQHGPRISVVIDQPGIRPHRVGHDAGLVRPGPVDLC